MCCLLEARFTESISKSFGDDDLKFHIFWRGNSNGKNGVAKAIKGRLTENVLEVTRINEGIMRLKLVLGHTKSNDVSAYASQAGIDDSKKEDFHNTLEDTMCVISEEEDSHNTLEDTMSSLPD